MFDFTKRSTLSDVSKSLRQSHSWKISLKSFFNGAPEVLVLFVHVKKFYVVRPFVAHHHDEIDHRLLNLILKLIPIVLWSFSFELLFFKWKEHVPVLQDAFCAKLGIEGPH